MNVNGGAGEALRPSVSIVIPLYNEARRLHFLREGLIEFCAENREFEFEVIIVDNGSDDLTPQGLVRISSELERQNPPPRDIVVIRQSENLGKGGAIKRGVGAASADWILTIDADMATRPVQLLEWVRSGRVDLGNRNTVYIGNRESEESRVNDSSGRRGLGRIFNRLVRKAVNLQVDDTQCGFKLYPRHIAQECFESLRHLGWVHDVEILAHVSFAGAKIVSLPVHWTAVPDGKIALLRDSLKMIAGLVSIRADLKKRDQLVSIDNK